MASEFQQRKIAGVFGAMDADGDRHLDETDFRALTSRWTGIRGMAPESAEAARLGEIMMGWWGTLAGAAGSDRVSLADVLTVVDRLAEMPDAVTATAEAMFEAVDENGDGEIAAAEYRRLIEAWTGREADTGEVFGLLDLNGDGHLSKTEFAEHWTEFWAGDNPDAPGSWVFGRF